MTTQPEYKNKRIMPVFLDMNAATENTIDFKSLGFEPSEVRLLQYGTSNGQAGHVAGVLICDELKDFNLIIGCGATTSVTNQAKLSCPSRGPLSSLTFRYTLTGKDANQDAQDMQVFLVLEFLRK